MTGDVDFKYYGHAGFKIQFIDQKFMNRNIYINLSPENQSCPTEDKVECPNDADLILITDGH